MSQKVDPASIEERLVFTPKFDSAGLIPCVTIDQGSGEVLMVASLNAEALRLTIETGIMHYWSRSRRCLWRKGDTSGQIQSLMDLRTDCDQDTLLAFVEVGGDGGACHTGRRTCFYRSVVRAGAGDRLILREDGDRIPS